MFPAFSLSEVHFVYFTMRRMTLLHFSLQSKWMHFDSYPLSRNDHFICYFSCTFRFTMASNEHNNDPITSQPTSKSASRKVSINSDKGLDNPAYEHTAGRKISQNSLHGEGVPFRKRSILHNAPLNPPYSIDEVPISNVPVPIRRRGVCHNNPLYPHPDVTHGTVNDASLVQATYTDVTDPLNPLDLPDNSNTVATEQSTEPTSGRRKSILHNGPTDPPYFADDAVSIVSVQSGKMSHVKRK